LIPYLKKMKIQCQIDDGSDLNTDIGILIRWQDESAFDLVNRLRDKKVKTVLDLCVNYFDEAGPFPGGHGVTPIQVKAVKKTARVVDRITCGSEYIRTKAKLFDSKALYLPESIDYKHFRFQKNKQDFDKPILMAIWSGQPEKSVEVAMLQHKLKTRQIPLTIISEKKPIMPHNYNYIPWSYYSFPKSILSGDFCISPRRADNTYDLGHSHFKIGAFMSQGVPALAAPLPSYKELIMATGAGRICESDVEWEIALNEILENRKRLWEWSQAAYEGMKEYSTESVAGKYAKFFQELLDG